MKAYTDLEQSKKLAEILPLKSADMKILPFTEREYRIVPINDIAVCDREDEVYCWSLAALLDVLPYGWLTNHVQKKYRVMDNLTIITEGDYDNPVDACVEMIIKLHDLNLL